MLRSGVLFLIVSSLCILTTQSMAVPKDTPSPKKEQRVTFYLPQDSSSTEAEGIDEPVSFRLHLSSSSPVIQDTSPAWINIDVNDLQLHKSILEFVSDADIENMNEWTDEKIDELVSQYSKASFSNEQSVYRIRQQIAQVRQNSDAKATLCILHPYPYTLSYCWYCKRIWKTNKLSSLISLIY